MKVRGKLEKTQLLDLYRQMLLIREFEEEAERQYMQGNIRGFLHVYTGEEAIAVGAISALRPQDYIVTHYRDHGHALARGITPRAVMAELFGKSTGCSKGKGGSMHLFDVEKNFMGGYAIVGGQIPIAVGLALSAAYKKEDQLALCFLGDGALNEGVFHESMNLASIWKLPIIFFCENNFYGMGAHVSETLALHDEIFKLADAYKMPSKRIDGTDVLEVREATNEAVEFVTSEGRPIFLEAQVYRFRGHSIADPAGYRDRDELAFWRGRDSILNLKHKLLDEEQVPEHDLEEMAAATQADVTDAVDFAHSSPFPEPDDLYRDVYAT